MVEKKVNKAWMPIAIVLMLLCAVTVLHDLGETPTIVEKEVIKEIIKEVNVSVPMVPEAPTVSEIIGYLIDELFLSVGLDEETYSDREVITLFDGKVKFDGDSYDAEETITLTDGIILMANENDYEGNVYMTILEEAVEYTMTFENDLNTSLIDEEDTLEFNFLGESYEVSDWNNDLGEYEVTLNKGIEQKVNLGECVVVDGKSVCLTDIGADGDEVYMCVDGEDNCKDIDEEKSRTINGIEIYVDSIFNSFAHVIMGEDVEVTIEHEDEYEEDSAFEYVITKSSIGIKLVEEHSEVDLDGDEEFQAFAKDSGLCLPNQYVCVLFNGMSEEDTEEYNLELDEKSSVDYVKIDGNFESGTSDYDRIYVNVLDYKVFDRDFDEITGTIELGDTDSKLITNVTGLFFEDFNVNYALDESNIGTGDEDYLTDFGVLVINPEDSVEDNEFNIFVPEKQLEGSISLI